MHQSEDATPPLGFFSRKASPEQIDSQVRAALIRARAIALAELETTNPQTVLAVASMLVEVEIMDELSCTLQAGLDEIASAIQLNCGGH